MKKCIFLFVILNICAISTLHSQWLEKEGYWELSEKIPDLRDLKILPEENLIITVSKDNTIRHIEYDSGKILKSGKPNGLPDSNDYAKISSDGKTTVVARYVKNELHSAKTRMTIKDMEIGLVRNIDNSLLVNQKIDADSILGVYYYDKNPDDMFGLEYYNYSIGYFDYFSTENRFFYTINYTLRWEGRANTGGEPTYNVSSGYQRNGSIVDGMLVTTKRYNSHYTNEYIPLDINHENYVLVGSNYYSMGNAHRDETKIHNFVAKKNRINNDLQLQVQYNYNYSSQRGDWGESES